QERSGWSYAPSARRRSLLRLAAEFDLYAATEAERLAARVAHLEERGGVLVVVIPSARRAAGAARPVERLRDDRRRAVRRREPHVHQRGIHVTGGCLGRHLEVAGHGLPADHVEGVRERLRDIAARIEDERLTAAAGLRDGV